MIAPVPETREVSAVNLTKSASNIKLSVFYVDMICITHESQPPKNLTLIQRLTFNHLFSFLSYFFQGNYIMIFLCS